MKARRGLRRRRRPSPRARSVRRGRGRAPRRRRLAGGAQQAASTRAARSTGSGGSTTWRRRSRRSAWLRPSRSSSPSSTRPRHCRALLDDLAAQEPPVDEVVVVDAGSTDGTLELLRRLDGAGPRCGWSRRPAPRRAAAGTRASEPPSAPVVVTLDAGSRVGPGLRRRARRDGRWRGAVAVGVSEPDARTAFERAAGWFTLGAFKPPERSGPIAGQHLPAGRNGVCFTRDAWEARRRLSAGAPLGRGQGLPAGAPRRRARGRGRRRRRSSAGGRAARCGRSTASTATTGAATRSPGIDRQNELVTFGIYGAGILPRRARRPRLADGAGPSPRRAPPRTWRSSPWPPGARSAGAARSRGFPLCGSWSTSPRCTASSKARLLGGRLRR